jgi:hypothetical protein
MKRLLLLSAVLALVLAAPASALKLRDRSNGWQLQVRSSGDFTLRFDRTYGNESHQFDVECARRKNAKKHLVAAFIPITPARSTTGDFFDWNDRQRRCDVTKTPAGDPDAAEVVARFELRRVR